MKNYYEVLELSVDANLNDLEEAYKKMKKIISSDNIATYSLYNGDKIKEINKEIEEAYNYIKNELKSKSHNKSDEKVPVISENRSEINEDETLIEIPKDVTEKINIYETDIDGSILKIIREHKNISLKEVSEAIKLRMKIISDIEKNNYTELPARVFVRGFVINYAKFLNLDSEKVANDYMAKYDDFMRNI